MNYTYIEDPELRKWFYNGTGYKSYLSDSILKSIEIGLDDYIANKLKLKISFPNHQLWKEAIINKCSLNIHRNVNKIQPQNNLSRHAQRTLQILKQHFAITMTDKLHRNFSLVCKHLYLHRLYKELYSSSYANSNDTMFCNFSTIAKNIPDSYSNILPSSQ